MEDDAPQVEFEVEDILRYRRDNATGEEYFMVKWQGFSAEEATWEPLAHMNDNCKELIMKARALFAWRKPHSNAEVSLSEELPETLEVSDPYGLPEDPVDGVAQTPIQQEVFSPPSEAGGGNWVTTIVPQTGSRPWPGNTTSGSTAPTLVVDNYGNEGQINASTPKVAPQAVPDALKRAAAAPAGAAKRPKLQAPSAGPPSAPGRGSDTGMQPVREMAAPVEAVPQFQEGPQVVCRICGGETERQTVESQIGCRVPRDYHCPPCRVERVDEFHPAVGAGLLRYSYASASSTLSLSFTAQAAQWRKQQWAVHLRSVALRQSGYSGPTWPWRVQGKLNGKQCVAIEPPKHLHVRREQCYNLTPLLRPGLNTLELKFTPKPDKPRDEPDEGYCIGVVLTRPRSVASIIARIRTRSTETVSSGRERVERIIRNAEKATDSEECKVTGNFGRMLKPLCPVSHCPIEESAIGRHCNHVQVFDLQAYIAVNQRMRSLDKRWTCPVCAAALRPDDVLLDPFAQGILDTLRGDEDLVEAVVFNENCTWSTISAAKADENDQNGEQGEDGTQKPAEIVDLSDSE
jgi:hypothetical protein